MSSQHLQESKIGRYEIAGRIARGGMAEILLGRLVGPSGFERAVVVKRILPHLADSATFIDMFLDEARIAARIRHTNVIQVHELGRDGDGLYIAMEYLEGESVASVMRRLTSRRMQLGHSSIAHICACAAAGLHAAHELTDADGNPEHLVHRDVSPQNIFVTYEGGVKVLDFGIAKIADRVSKTRTGELKGKFGYMSPEQVGGRSVDRRSDTFALGIVLYELVTGRRLFKRPTQVATIDAVRKHLIASPTELDPTCPQGLSDICMKALARDPGDRYQTATDLRRDLVLFATPGEAALPEEGLARMMKALFADRIEEKREMLRRFQSGSDLSRLPAAEVDEEISLPTVEGVEAGSLSVPSRAGGPASAVRSRRRLVALLLSGALVVSLAALGSFWKVREPDDSLVAGRERVAVEDEPTASAEPKPVEENVTLSFSTTPGNANVLLDGTAVGNTPTTISVPHSETPLDVRFVLEGYEPISETVTPEQNAHIRVSLKPSAQDIANKTKPKKTTTNKRSRRSSRRRASPTPPANKEQKEHTWTRLP